MVQLVFQTLAFVAGAFVLRALLLRLGVDLRLPQLTALTVLLFLAVFGAWNLRERWNGMDDQRDRYDGLSAQAAAGTCTAVGVDGGFLAFVGSKIPVREPYYMEIEGGLVGSGDNCIRLHLLPRVQVRTLEQARWIVFWNPASKATIERYRQLGATFFARDRDHLVARVP